MRRQWFKGLKRAPVRREVMAFDVEGSGKPGRFLCGSIVSDHTCHYFTDRQAMWEALLYYGARGAWLWAHNLEYDLPIVAGDALFDGHLLFTRGAMLWATYGEGRRKAHFYDSKNLFPRFSVDSIGGMVGLPKIEVPRELVRRMSLGLPLSSFTPDEQALIERYNRRDAEVVFRGVAELQDLSLSLGGQLRPTIAGISMDVYRRKFHRWPWLSMGEAGNELARPAFYGGRTESYKVGRVPDVNLYDVTSLYPWVLSTAPFPHPNHLHLQYPRSPVGDFWGWEGVIQARVTIPEDFIPPLPVRYKGRLFFPTGQTDGLWTLAELRAAIMGGVQLDRVEWVFGSDVTFNPFDEFVETLFHKRRELLDTGDIKSNLVKLILNSLYGRFGLNPDGGLERLIPLVDPVDWDDLHGYTVIELNGDLVARGPLPKMRYPPYINTLFASQITAFGRMRLLEQLAEQGEAAAYCDTDSVMTSGVLATGEGLGEWRLERERVNADLIGPKEYALYQSGVEAEYKAKGIPDSVRETYLRTGAARFFRALSIREALAQGKEPAQWVEAIKNRLTTFPKRATETGDIPPGQTWKATRPYSVRELEAFGLSRPRVGSGLPSLEGDEVLTLSPRS